MEECKSPESEALVAAAVRGPNQVASAAARVEAHAAARVEAQAAVAAVQAGVDKRRAEALAPVQAESEGRRAAAASAAATAASATAAPSLLSPSPAESRTPASAKQVWQVVGFLMHFSFAVRPGRFFVNRLLASVGMPGISAGDDFRFRTANPGRHHVLVPEFQRTSSFGGAL